MRFLAFLLPLVLLTTACERLENVGKPPGMTAIEGGAEHRAMTASEFPQDTQAQRPADRASLWSGGRQSLLGDRRAQNAGDILTVVIEINDQAEFKNSSQRARSGSETMGVPNLLSLPQLIDGQMAEGATMGSAIETNSDSASSGNGSTKRNEKLTLRIAATVLGTLPNGVLQIQGTQEVRVNFELRELLVTGFVRPEDISRQNEIPYDKIASARISYGGRGQITDVQQPRYGQQVADIVLPF